MLKKLFGSKAAPAEIRRQGDVFIISIPKLPSGLSGARPVLAEGEATGHAHRIADPATAQVFTGPAGLFLQVTSARASIIHDEHAPLTLPRGCYEIRIQREYHPQEIRRV